MSFIRWRAAMPAVVLGCVLVLAGCGGGSSAASGPDPVDPVALPEPPGDTGDNDPTGDVGATNDAPLDAPKNLAVQYNDNQQVLEWEPQPDADRYEVLEDPDGSGPLPPVVIDTPTEPNFSRPLTLPMRLRPQASYSVRACTRAACSEPSAAARGDADALVSRLVKQRGYPGEGFGRALALSADGGTLAVAVPLETTVLEGVVTNPQGDGGPRTDPPTGAVVVFTRSPDSGHWRQQAVIKPLNPLVVSGFGSDDWQFGNSLALSADGSILVVGSAGDSSVANGVNVSSAGMEGSPGRWNSGAVHVFARASDTWSEQAYIKTASPQTRDLFGASVALSGDGRTLAVGAPQTSNDSGSVHLYLRVGSQPWSAVTIVRASNAAERQLFGSAVALSQDGRTLAASAPAENGAATAPLPGAPSGAEIARGWNAGAAYVFTRETDTEWPQQAYIKGSQQHEDGGFGTALSLSADGSTLAVGAAGDDRLGPSSEPGQFDADVGAAYIFTRAGGAWTEAAYLKAATPQRQSGFGASLALSADGSLLAVGADRQSGGDSAAGAVFVYRRSDDPQWPAWATVMPRRNTEGQRFGVAVAVSGEGDGAMLAIGAPNEGEPDPGQPSRGGPGAVFMY